MLGFLAAGTMSDLLTGFDAASLFTAGAAIAAVGIPVVVAVKAGPKVGVRVVKWIQKLV